MVARARSRFTRTALRVEIGTDLATTTPLAFIHTNCDRAAALLLERLLNGLRGFLHGTPPRHGRHCWRLSSGRRTRRACLQLADFREQHVAVVKLTARFCTSAGAPAGIGDFELRRDEITDQGLTQRARVFTACVVLFVSSGTPMRTTPGVSAPVTLTGSAPAATSFASFASLNALDSSRMFIAALRPGGISNSGSQIFTTAQPRLGAHLVFRARIAVARP
jgi:hypothetical protein